MTEPTETTTPGPQSADRLEQVANWVAAQREVDRGEIDLVKRHAAAAPAAGHGCEGQLTVDTYFDDNGYEHIVIGHWYPCEGYWEDEEDLLLLG